MSLAYRTVKHNDWCLLIVSLTLILAKMQLAWVYLHLCSGLFLLPLLCFMLPEIPTHVGIFSVGVSMMSAFLSAGSTVLTHTPVHYCCDEICWLNVVKKLGFRHLCLRARTTGLAVNFYTKSRGWR